MVCSGRGAASAAFAINTSLVRLNSSNMCDFNNADDFVSALGGDLSQGII